MSENWESSFPLQKDPVIIKTETIEIVPVTGLVRKDSNQPTLCSGQQVIAATMCLHTRVFYTRVRRRALKAQTRTAIPRCASRQEGTMQAGRR